MLFITYINTLVRILIAILNMNSKLFSKAFEDIKKQS